MAVRVGSGWTPLDPPHRRVSHPQATLQAEHEAEKTDTGDTSGTPLNQRSPSFQEVDEGRPAFTQWFKQLKLPQYEAKFVEHGIQSLRHLRSVTDQELKMLVSKPSDRRTLACAVSRLQTDLALRDALPGPCQPRVS